MENSIYEFTGLLTRTICNNINHISVENEEVAGIVQAENNKTKLDK